MGEEHTREVRTGGDTERGQALNGNRLVDRWMGVLGWNRLKLVKLGLTLWTRVLDYDVTTNVLGPTRYLRYHTSERPKSMKIAYSTP